MKRQAKVHKTKQPAGRRADAGWVALWGSAAILFAMVGASSVYFTDGGRAPLAEMASEGTLLPPPGKVSTTASIGKRTDEDRTVQIYPSSGGVEAEQARRQMEAELDTLRREVASLRRGLAILQEQREIERERKDGAREKPAHDAGNTTVKTPPVTAKPDTQDPDRVMSGAPAAEKRVPHERAIPRKPADTAKESSFREELDRAILKVAGAPRRPVETVPAPAPWRNNEADKKVQAADAAPASDPVETAMAKQPATPVRIVALPSSEPPASVASIPQKAVLRKPKPLQVTRAAGHLDEDSGGRIARTDFALDLGRFDSETAAEETWKEIRAAQTLLPSSIAHSKLAAPEGKVRLLAGPFHNAADAAAACVYLAAEAVTCAAVPYPRDLSASR